MIGSVLPLFVVVPLQLGAAAAVEASGGYDSTVLNENTRFWGDGGLARGALDLQGVYRSETFRMILRNRTEAFYGSGTGRPFDASDLLNISRLSALWEPDDNWRLHAEGNYAVGRTSQLMGRAGRPDLSFLPGVYADYGGRLEVSRMLGEEWRLLLETGLTGRYGIEIPRGQPRTNMVQAAGQLALFHDFNEDNVGLVAARAEYFMLDGFLDPVYRVVGWLGFTRNWTDNLTTVLYGGVDAMQDQNDVSRWNVGPYGSLAITQQWPDQRVAIGATVRHQYGLVSGPRVVQGSAGNVPLAGGVGPLTGASVFLLWYPGDLNRWTIAGDATWEYGTTTNPTGVGTATRDVVNQQVIAGLGLRFLATEWLYAFARYEFLYQLAVPPYDRDMVRHVAFAGLGVVLGTSSSAAEGLLPLEMVDAIQGISQARRASNAVSSDEAPHARAADDARMPGDPFDLGQQDEPGRMPRMNGPGGSNQDGDQGPDGDSNR